MNIKKILKKEPTLTPNGIEKVLIDDKFEGDYLRQIETCVEWLKHKKTQKTISRSSTSYAIKHIIERELNTYVCNGSLIAAVIYLGIPYERMEDSPNIQVAIGIKELYKNDPHRG